MRVAYLAESRYFFALILLYIAATLAQTLVADGALRWSDSMVLRCIIIVAVTPMIWTRSLAYRWFATVVTLVTWLTG